jgi:thioredoxin 1
MMSSLSRRCARNTSRFQTLLPECTRLRSQKLDHRFMSVITLSDLEAVKKFTQLNSKCCIYYTADWCSPCQAIKPIYKDLAATYNGTIALGLVNVDDNPMAGAAAKVSAVPTFRLIHNNEETQTFAGADQDKLRSTLSELAAK